MPQVAQWTGERPGRWAIRSLIGLLALLGLPSMGEAEYGGPSGRPMLDPTLEAYMPATQTSGHMKIAGSDTMQPLLARLAGEFRRRHFGARVSIEGGGSDIVLKEFLAEQSKPARVAENGPEGVVVVAASSRLLTDEETKRFVARHGYEPTVFPVAVDAVGIYVHRDNPLTHLTLDQVDAIFSTTRNRGYAREITRWGELGLRHEWDNAPIRLYGRNQKSGTRTFVKEHVLRYGEFSPAVHEEPGAASVILSVSRDPLGMGYSGIGLQASTVRLIPLAEKDGAPPVMPSVASVMDGSYPLRRFLYLYLDRPATASLPPLAREFLAFVNSREGQEAVIQAGFYPLPLTQTKQSLALLASPSAR